MKTNTKAGGLGVLGQGLIFAELTFFYIVLFPTLGYDPAMFADAAKTLSFVATQPLLWHLSGPDVLYAMVLFLGALGLHEWLSHDAPHLAKVATACGLVAVPLFLGLGLMEFIAIPQLAQLYAQNPAEASAAYLGANAVMTGIENAGIFAAGWWTLLVSWAALRTGRFGKILNYVGIFTGVMTTLSVIVPVLAFVAILPNLIWTFWLGITLVRGEQGLSSAPAAMRA